VRNWQFDAQRLTSSPFDQKTNGPSQFVQLLHANEQIEVRHFVDKKI
jgi:hypothetical protein